MDQLDAAAEVPADFQAQYDGEGPARRLRKLRRLLWNEPDLYGPMLNRAGVTDLAEAVVDQQAVAVFHAAFLKPARIGTHVAPHQDQALWSKWYPGAFSVWFALTDVVSRNGGLYGFPGSHAGGVIPHQDDPAHPWHETLNHTIARLGAAHQFELAPGEAVMWDRCFVHGSEANVSDKDRRGMVLVFADGSANDFDAIDAMPLQQIHALGGASR